MVIPFQVLFPSGQKESNFEKKYQKKLPEIQEALVSNQYQLSAEAQYTVFSGTEGDKTSSALRLRLSDA